jgi:hypothetical protein
MPPLPHGEHLDAHVVVVGKLGAFERNRNFRTPVLNRSALQIHANIEGSEAASRRRDRVRRS